MTVVDLLSDESFINYCKKSSPEDVAFWEAYGKDNPEALLLMENAAAEFIVLFNALAANDLDEQANRLRNKLNKIETPVVRMQEPEVKKSKKAFHFLKRFAAVAAVLAAVLFGIRYATDIKKDSLKLFVAACGERKFFQLPDGTVVTLNGGSKLQTADDFGISNRNIYLEGEAFFDVKHNEKLPFIVHTAAMDVKALGTAFNVKAYPGDRITETSLLRGLVEVTLNESNNRKMLLHPNEKVQWEKSNNGLHNTNTALSNKDPKPKEADSLLKKLYTTEEGNIREIAWKESKLIFENDSFEDIAPLLERWYGVKISIQDEAIRKYRFTGFFEKEELNTVLNLLKESRSFNYDVEPGKILQINITK
jgi:ferric-dicitrate binding protein FerR (iron transport regulator)